MRTVSLVSDRAKSVSLAVRGFYDPHTGTGIGLDGFQPAAPVIHECGFMVLGSDWNYCGVCSPFWRAYANLDPGAAVRIGDRRIPLRPGAVVILPEETRYDCLPKAGVRHLWIHFSISHPTIRPAPSVVKFPEGTDWASLANAIARELPPARLAPLCLGLLIPVLSAGHFLNPEPVDPAWSRFCAWVDAHMTAPPSLSEMARWLGASPRTFQRWFAQHSDEPPAAWLTRRRIREACRRLRFSRDSIEHVAEATGFANRHHFSRIFHQETGTTPAAFRRT